MENSSCLHLNLDDAWPRDVLPQAHYLDVLEWGPHLRFCAPSRLVEDFYDEVKIKL